MKNWFINKLKENERLDKKYRSPEFRDTPEAKRHYRKMGMGFILGGCIAALAGLVSLITSQSIPVLWIAIVIVLIPLGMYVVSVGRLPKWMRKGED